MNNTTINKTSFDDIISEMAQPMYMALLFEISDRDEISAEQMVQSI